MLTRQGRQGSACKWWCSGPPRPAFQNSNGGGTHLPRLVLGHEVHDAQLALRQLDQLLQLKLQGVLHRLVGPRPF